MIDFRLTKQRVHKPGRKHRARETPKLKTIGVNHISGLALHQHIQIVEISDHHAGPMQRLHRAMQVQQHPIHRLLLHPRRPIRPLPQPQQRFRPGQQFHRVPHRFSPHRFACFLHRRYHSWGQIGRKLLEFLPIHRQSLPGRLLLLRQPRKVWMLLLLPNFHRHLRIHRKHIRLAPFSQGLTRVQAIFFSVDVNSHGCYFILPLPLGEGRGEGSKWDCLF